MSNSNRYAKSSLEIRSRELPKLLYITANTPWGRGEPQILKCMLTLKKQGIPLIIIPRNPTKKIFHNEAWELLENAIWLPLINFAILFGFIKTLLTKKSAWEIIFLVFKNSRSFTILIKNLAVLPKAFYVADRVKREGIYHIHAHWGSTTATMAYAVSKLTNTRWSFTLHRWDIKENNMLKEKVKAAKFARLISRHGYHETLEIIGPEYKNKCFVLHMGVYVPETIVAPKEENKESFVIATVANLVEVKGHKYLIQAIKILKEKGYHNVKCYFIGEGPLRQGLEKIVINLGLNNNIIFKGALPNDALYKLYAQGEIDCVVLPSIITDKGEHEGIPVSLMEAMAFKIPVISTNTGGIPELLENDSGIIVNQKDPEELAKAIETLIRNKELRKKISENGYRKVKSEFWLPDNTKKLLELIMSS